MSFSKKLIQEEAPEGMRSYEDLKERLEDIFGPESETFQGIEEEENEGREEEVMVERLKDILSADEQHLQIGDVIYHYEDVEQFVEMWITSLFDELGVDTPTDLQTMIETMIEFMRDTGEDEITDQLVGQAFKDYIENGER